MLLLTAAILLMGTNPVVSQEPKLAECEEEMDFYSDEDEIVYEDQDEEEFAYDDSDTLEVQEIVFDDETDSDTESEADSEE